jgi:hypothetical protein
LGLEGAVPDHSTFCKNRYGRFGESKIYRRVLFEEIVERCRQAGLVPGEGLAGDDSSCMATRAAIGAFKASMRFGKEIHFLITPLLR